MLQNLLDELVGKVDFTVLTFHVVAQIVFFFVAILLIGYIAHHMVYWIDITHRERFEEEYGNYAVFTYLFKNSIGVRILKMSFQGFLAIIFCLRIKRLRRLPLDELPPMFYHRERWFNFWLPEDSIPAIYVRKPRWFNLWGKLGAYVLAIAPTILAVIIPVVTMWLLTPVTLSTMFEGAKTVATHVSEGSIGDIITVSIPVLISSVVNMLICFTENWFGWLVLVLLTWWFGVKFIVPSFQNIFRGGNLFYFFFTVIIVNYIIGSLTYNAYLPVAEDIFAAGCVSLVVMLYTLVVLIVWSLLYLLVRGVVYARKWPGTHRY